MIGVVDLQFKDFDKESETKSQNASANFRCNLVEANVDVENIGMNKLKEVLNSFQNASLGWNKYPNTIESAEISIKKFEKTKYDLYTQEEFGWYTEIRLKVKIKEDAKHPSYMMRIPEQT